MRLPPVQSNTPDIGGHALATLIALAGFGGLCQAAGLGPGLWMPVALVLLALYVSIFTFESSPAGARCDRLRRPPAPAPFADQRIYVAGTFAIPYGVVAPFSITDPPDGPMLAGITMLAVSMAAGRAAVIPLVRSRRRQLARSASIQVL